MADMRTRAPSPGGDTKYNERSAFSFEQRSQDERRDEESIPELLRQLAEQGSHLAEQQAKLVQAEVRASMDDLMQAAGAMAGAAVVGIAGLGVMLMGLSFLLDKAMPLWAGTLIVAAVSMIAAYAMFAAARKKIQHSSFRMNRTRETLERAPSAISGNSNEGHRHDR